MNTQTTSSYWSRMTDDERKQFLQMVQQFDKMAHEFRNMVRRALTADPQGADEPAWREAELIDLYQGEVQRGIGRAEDRLWESGAAPEDEPLDGFSRHCRAGYRRGWTASWCAREWRCRPG